MNTRYILLLILSTTVLAACVPVIGELKPFDTTVYANTLIVDGFQGLTLNVVEERGKLKLTVLGHSNPRCSAEDRKLPGCLSIRRGYQADIGFRLHSDDVADGWVLTEFRICKGKKKPPEDEDCKTIRAERREWDASISKTSDKLIHLDKNGIIDLTKLSLNLTQFVLHDQNSHRQDYFYNIEACKGSVCVDFDPGARNGGGK
jgi:hypothetical protein